MDQTAINNMTDAQLIAERAAIWSDVEATFGANYSQLYSTQIDCAVADRGL